MAKDTGAGGAAADGGVGFGVRAAAWFGASMLAGRDVSPTLEVQSAMHIESIAVQTADAVDDSVLRGGGTTVYIQAKRTIALSAVDGSEFGKVVGQFVRQFMEDGPDAAAVYVLVTGPLASRKVTDRLRRVLRARRLAPGSKGSCTAAEDNEVEATFRAAADAEAQRIAGRQLAEAEHATLAMRARVLVMDVETGGIDERTANYLLAGMSGLRVEPDLVWAKLLATFLDAGRDRSLITKSGLESMLARYLMAGSPGDAQVENGGAALFQWRMPASYPSGREIIAGHNSEVAKDALLVAEFIRFNADGTRRLRFESGQCTAPNGLAIEVLARAATPSGIERWLESNAIDLKNRRVVIAQASPKNEPDDSASARAHSATILKALNERKDRHLCFVCGRAVSTHGSPIVEVDEVGEPPTAGVIHERCVRPTYRRIGALRCDFMVEHKSLVDFDYLGWVECFRRGQGLFSNGKPPVKATVAWESSPAEDLDYCLRMDLDGGRHRPVARRMRVQRFSRVDAEESAREFNRAIRAARQRGDPLSVSMDSFVFGQYSRVVPMAPSEEVVNISRVVSVPYTVAIGEVGNVVDNYYAPLCVIRNMPGEELFELCMSVVFLTDPLVIDAFLRNWSAAGLAPSSYRVDIVRTDSAFDDIMRAAVRRKVHGLIDPLVDLEGRLVSGWPVVPLDQLLSESQQ